VNRFTAGRRRHEWFLESVSCALDRIPRARDNAGIGARRRARNLKVKLQELYAWGRAELGESRLNHDTLDPTPDVRPGASQAAQDVYTEFARHIEKRMDQDQTLSHLSRGPATLRRGWRPYALRDGGATKQPLTCRTWNGAARL
jgi:hypothetical protein